MEINKYKGEPLEKVYEGDKINDLINIDKQIRELKEKRRAIMKEIRDEVIKTPRNEYPIPGFLYFDTEETELIQRRYGWGKVKVPNGNMTHDARLIFITGYTSSEYFGDNKQIVFSPNFNLVGCDNKPGNSIYKSKMYNMEFEPLDGMTLDEAKKFLKKVKKDLKKEEK